MITGGRGYVLVLPFALAVLVACGASSSGGGVCAQPEASSTTSTVAPGGSVELRGRFFLDGCNDQNETRPLPTLRDQAVVWEQGGQSVELARVDADRNGEVAVTVTVPSNAAPGPGRITVGTGVPVSVTVAAE